jgi:hypothetical protein
MLRSRFSPKRNFSEIVPCGDAIAIHVVPIGLAAVPPSGPKIPEVAIE